MIIMDPRVARSERGKTSDALALNLDLPSTFLDWAGVPIPEHYQGRSLAPVISGQKPSDWRTETFHEHFAVRHRIPAYEGIRTERYKYVRYFDHGNYEFLHDLKDDPDELVNLAGNPKFSRILQDLRKRTDQTVANYGGPLDPLKVPFTLSSDPHPVASAAVTVRPGSDGFVDLLDGPLMRNWSGDTQYWSMKNGVLTGVTDGSLKLNRFISWKGSTVRNFDLRVKVKVTKGGNSGLQYRGRMAPDLGLDIVTGYQADVVPSRPEYNGMLYEEKERRILSRTGQKVIIDKEGQPWIVGTTPVKEFAPEEWHDYRVLVRGNHHQHWIDGHLTADVLDFDEEGRDLDGVLAVQVHVGPEMKIQYKDFKIKHLPDNLPLQQASDHPIPKGSPGVKPQGRLPKDWTPPTYGGS